MRFVQLESIGQCLSLNAGDLYAETATTNVSSVNVTASGANSSSAAATGSSGSSGAAPRTAVSVSALVGVGAVLLASLL